MNDIKAGSPLSSCLDFPWQLARNNNLDTQFENFLGVCRPPENLRCLYLVISRLLDAFDAVPSFKEIQPFKDWPPLFDLLQAHMNDVSNECGRQVQDGLAQRSQEMRTRKGHPLHRQIEGAPLFAMLCSAHNSLPEKFGALQLQIVHAHWLKREAFKKDHPDHVGEILEERRKGTTQERHIKMSNTAARTVRAILHKDLEEWLKNLDPTCSPDDFLEELDKNRPPDKELRILHDRIACYCVPGYKPGSGGSGGERRRSIHAYLPCIG